MPKGEDDWKPDAKQWGHYADDEEVEVQAPPPVVRHSAQAVASVGTPVVEFEPDGQTVSPSDRLVVRASNVLADLVAQSSSYDGIDWAVAAYTDSAGHSSCVATSNEGYGFLPWGLRWPPDVKPVFGLSTSPGQEIPWQGLANPARALADHFSQLRSAAKSGLKLVTIVGSAPLGPAVCELMEREGAVFAPASTTAAQGKGRGLRRLETVSKELSGLVERTPVGKRWAAGSYLMANAVEVSELGEHYPSILDIAQRAWAGDVTGDDFVRVQYARRQLTARAQIERVPDGRVGPVLAGLSWQQREEHDVVPEGGVLSYALPFCGARACVVLERIIAGWVQGRELDAEDLAELAYEHYCVVEDLSETSRILSGQI